jgi:hypothetical protein
MPIFRPHPLCITTPTFTLHTGKCVRLFWRGQNRMVSWYLCTYYPDVPINQAIHYDCWGLSKAPPIVFHHCAGFTTTSASNQIVNEVFHSSSKPGSESGSWMCHTFFPQCSSHTGTSHIHIMQLSIHCPAYGKGWVNNEYWWELWSPNDTCPVGVYRKLWSTGWGHWIFHPA